MKNIIDFNNVSFSYNKHKVLDNINFTVEKGDFVGIIGPNGSGKSTLLKVILNLLKPQSGDVKIFDSPIEDFKSWGKVGYVPQKVTQLETKFPITVEEVVSLGRTSRLGLWNRKSKKDQQEIYHAEEIIDIVPLKNMLITELSGGQQQKVFIAKALASKPELLILDEPTTGVDAESQESFYKLLSKLNKELGITIVLVSHDIGVVVNEVKTLFCINKSLVYHGSPEKFLQGKHLEEIYGKDIRVFLHGH